MSGRAQRVPVHRAQRENCKKNPLLKREERKRLLKEHCARRLRQQRALTVQMARSQRYTPSAASAASSSSSSCSCSCSC
eukprot:CAMPEP_0177658596 /NCGR_PEP_ID=MMETSP0447-20121125/16909_1 /TAXON_ID=0 /ORGANISM="Stygamoeba regulata, Strain BSH-02190019" /LENGTH=78 /DNA_ID=CAMNT_0019163241 /DNA_START=215 /DNA_END=448 /DNA_ORIENTATION=+